MVNKKRILESLLVFLGFSFFVFILNFTLQSLNYDIIWCFHISQKIANGYELYSEIGTVVTPIYFWIGSIFIKLFGNSIVSMDLYGGVVGGAIATIIFNIIQETKNKENTYANVLFVFYMLLSLTALCLSNYNTCSIMWVLLAAFLEVRKERKLELKISTFTKKKENTYNLMIGIILGLAFFTKQNIGTYGVLATGIFSLIYKWFIRKENTLKEILMKASGFVTVLISFILYFVFKGTFVDFMNFCIGGLLEFGNKNLRIGMPSAYAGVLTILTLCIGRIRLKRENNVVWVAEITYLMCMMLLVYPLTNSYHIHCAMLMVVPVYMILLDRVVDYKVIYDALVGLFAIFVIFISTASNEVMTKTELVFVGTPSLMETFVKIFFIIFVMGLALSISFNKKHLPWYIISLSYFAFIFCGIIQHKMNVAQENVPETLSIYKNHGYRQETIDYIEEVVNYILKKEAEGEKVYVVSADASYYMAAIGRNQYKYDLNLYGSLGYKGEEVLIEETKTLGNVIIMKDKELMFQEPQKFDTFVKENYQAIDEVGNLIVYRKRE